MKIFDMHIHARSKKPNPSELIASMEKAGVYGGCIFSTKPLECDTKTGMSFEDRINEVLEWSKGYEDRLFPVLWIHPYEENINEKIKIAALKGICAFKIMCSNFYIYEDACIEVLTNIAKLNKPVIFHTGILWDGKVSSKYNQPSNWEALLKIKGLRFSMGHCSWPWVDECIALYGKFLNSLLMCETAEMFFDITPGTPQIYREELLTKLYTIGYDVGDNILFGTDATAHSYNDTWAASWLKTDNEILNKLGVSKRNREKLYYDNLLRFLGKTEVKINHTSPEVDDSHMWTPVNPKVIPTIEKWYDRLNFSSEYDKEFKTALNNIKIPDTTEIDSYTISDDGKRNFLSYLYMCEGLEQKYKEKNIPQAVLDDTLADIVTWNNIWSDIKNELHLGECEWLKHHLSMKLFKLGRLQFCMAKAESDIKPLGVEKGDNVIEVHIPNSGPLNDDECKKSLNLAREFFALYFPEFQYKCFTCHSWLLDETLKGLLNPDSNILKFQKLFVNVHSNKSDAILKYVFKWNTNRRKLKGETENSSLAKKVKEYALQGGEFYEMLGYIPK